MKAFGFRLSAKFLNSTMKKAILTFLLLSLFAQGVCQKISNEFFVLHNGIRGDSTYKTYDQQVGLIKSLGYDGVEINQIESYEGMKNALKQHGLKGSYFYVRIDADDTELDPELRRVVAELEGSGTIIAPYIRAKLAEHKPSTHGADATLVKHLSELSKLAQASGLQVAIYPHYGFYVETLDHAKQISRAVNQPNVGLSFNFCHWLATTPKADRGDWKKTLKDLKPHLKMVTICGANDVDTQDKNVWNDYILPLGQGSFDTYALVKYLVSDVKYQGPIGVQCYNIKADQPRLLYDTMETWKKFKARMEHKTETP